MAVPTVITDLSVTVASNSPAGADVVTAGAGPDEYMRALSAIVRREQAQGANVASAATVDLGAIADGNYIHITGTTTITAFGTVAAGIKRTVVFDGALTLTHNATSLILPGGANITTASGDVARFRSEGSGNWRCVAYDSASGIPVDAKLAALAGLAVTDGNFAVGNGTTWVAESGATVRTSLGLGTVATLNTGTGSGNVPVVGTSSATDALAGAVELATSAEAVTGTDTARAVTPAGGAAAIAALGIGGSGQSWQNVTASRASATTYTNSTGKPIFVSVFNTANNASSVVALYVDSVQVSSHTFSVAGALSQAHGHMIVPNGSNYSATYSGGTIKWMELR